MSKELQEPIRRKVGGTLSVRPPLERLETLRRNARWLTGGKWQQPADDGTHVRKTVGPTR